MTFVFNQYLREQLGGEWEVTHDGSTALLTFAYGNALVKFLNQRGIPVTMQSCGNNVRVTLDPSVEAPLRRLAEPLGQFPDADAKGPCPLSQLVLQQSGLASLGMVRG